MDELEGFPVEELALHGMRRMLESFGICFIFIVPHPAGIRSNIRSEQSKNGITYNLMPVQNEPKDKYQRPFSVESGEASMSW